MKLWSHETQNIKVKIYFEGIFKEYVGVYESRLLCTWKKPFTTLKIALSRSGPFYESYITSGCMEKDVYHTV